MADLIQELLYETAALNEDAPAISVKQATVTFGALQAMVRKIGAGLRRLGLKRSERVAVYLPKQIETVVAMVGACAAGGVFVPVNPALKPEQTAYILADCDVRILVTSATRYTGLASALKDCPSLHTIILTDTAGQTPPASGLEVLAWTEMLAAAFEPEPRQAIDTDMAAILYTSGSTGRPKGVVASHRNLVAGAHSVATYLGIHREDRLLAVLPFSFDYGLNQLMTTLLRGACCVLMDYLFPRDVIKAVARERITGLAAVPPLWVQLAQLPWPPEIDEHLRYMTSSGGKMPGSALDALHKAVPSSRFFVMYGLTEAFRSTYLPPEEIERRPGSIGKAIPNAEIMVVREDGSPCAPHEPGELVHRGALVTLGYWNDPERTAERYRPWPGQPRGLPIPELAVWSGDTVTRDEDGYFYFVGRSDGMIKTSGYRVSPTEVEEVIYASGTAGEVAVVGVPHPILGQAIVAFITKPQGDAAEPGAVIAACRDKLPNFMVPLEVQCRDSLPRNPNGKIDRRALAESVSRLFGPPES